MASALGIAATASNAIQAGGAALSLINSARSLISSDTLKPGIDGFLFDIQETDEISLNSQVTESYTEDNSAIADHITLEPIKIRLTGVVVELVQVTSKYEKFLQETIDRLKPLGILSPGMSASAQEHLTEATRLKSAASSALNIYNNLTDPDGVGKTKQEKAYAELENKWLNRGRITVQTNWKTFKNMIIESITFNQDEKTKHQTNITISFKEVRTVGVLTNTGNLVGRVAVQKTQVVEKGVAQRGESGLSKIPARGHGV